MNYTAIKLNAGNNANGNPRRLFLVIDSSGRIVAALDEGYRGNAALREWNSGYFGEGFYPWEIDTTPAEYRRLLKEYDEA